MQVQVPTVAFVGQLQRIETAAPVAGEFAATEPAKPALEFLDVGFGQVGNITDGEHYVLGLLDQLRPPFNRLAAFTSEAGLALGAEELIAPVWEPANLPAVVALGNGVVGMAILQGLGEVGPVGLARFGRYGLFVDRLTGPKFTLPGRGS